MVVHRSSHEQAPIAEVVLLLPPRLPVALLGEQVDTALDIAGALSCANVPYFPIVYHGILKAGAVVVPLNFC